MVMYQMIDIISPSSYLPYIAFSLAAFSALRLAKFNLDDRQSDTFIGLPTPANALFITSLVYLKGPWSTFISADWVLVVITLLFSFLLVSPWELFALKFKNYRWVENKVRFTFIGFSVLLLAIWQAAALPLVILLYILLSLLVRRN
jgi:CDP-diacylglycerol--serine O-phosphatidyltransferase